MPRIAGVELLAVERSAVDSLQNGWTIRRRTSTTPALLTSWSPTVRTRNERFVRIELERACATAPFGVSETTDRDS